MVPTQPAARGTRRTGLALALLLAALGCRAQAPEATPLHDFHASARPGGSGLHKPSWREDATHHAQADASAAVRSGANSLQIEPKRRWFARLGAAAIKPNDDSGDVRDITGPVLTASDHPLLGLIAPGVTSFGTPPGVTVDVREGYSVYGSVGKFLDDHWAIEGLVLALPFKHDIHGAGTIERLGKVATVKQLPPTVILHRYFGDWGAKFRPSLGVGINYTYFFDAKATPALESYTGGPTKIKMKPSWGLGLFAGAQYQVNERLHFKLTLGYVRVRTTGTMITRDTMLSGSSPVLSDYPYPVNQIPTDPTSRQAMDNLIGQVATARGGNLGTYERKIDSKLDPYVLLLSVGYSF